MSFYKSKQIRASFETVFQNGYGECENFGVSSGHTWPIIDLKISAPTQMVAHLHKQSRKYLYTAHSNVQEYSR